MRTNIEIDDTLMNEALEVSKLSTKKAVVEHALKEYILTMRRMEMLNFKGSMLWEGNLEKMRLNE